MQPLSKEIQNARKAAEEVLLHNARGPYLGLPRTAGWGYPEPYTRDLMFSIFGIAVSGNKVLMNSVRKVLETLAKNQSKRGHIPSLAHDKDDRGASDTTPLFLLGTAMYRQATGNADFLHEAVEKALQWMEYQSPSDRYLVAQQPTSDWRDEQWVLGYGLFVNTVVYSYQRMFGLHGQADKILQAMRKFTITEGIIHNHVHEGLAVKYKPYYAMWSYKILSSERFDLLGNSLAILSGIASPTRANEMISWIEAECASMRKKGELSVGLPPNFFPFVKDTDPEWNDRYVLFNKPGDYHNGGIWPFVCGIYIAALVAAKKYKLAQEKLEELTRLVRLSASDELEFGFNEWIKAQDGTVRGQDWQTWSAALYLYAVKCVEERRTPFFDEMRAHSQLAEASKKQTTLAMEINEEEKSPIIREESDGRKIVLPGYPTYPPEEDIYSQAKEETEIDPEEITRLKENEELSDENIKDFEDDVSGADLDIPGAELDDTSEMIGSEDEENNLYSLGGDNHD